MEAGWYELLLNADVNTIGNLCQSHKRAYEICNDNRFWIEKFSYDDLPIMTMQNTSAGWLKEYKDVYNAKTNAHNGVQQIIYTITPNTFQWEFFYEIELRNIFDFYVDLPDFLKEIIHSTLIGITSGRPNMLKILTKNDVLGIIYQYTLGGIKYNMWMPITYEELEKLFFNINYYKYTINNNITINSLM